MEKVTFHKQVFYVSYNHKTGRILSIKQKFKLRFFVSLSVFMLETSVFCSSVLGGDKGKWVVLFVCMLILLLLAFCYFWWWGPSNGVNAVTAAVFVDLHTFSQFYPSQNVVFH